MQGNSAQVLQLPTTLNLPAESFSLLPRRPGDNILMHPSQHGFRPVPNCINNMQGQQGSTDVSRPPGDPSEPPDDATCSFQTWQDADPKARVKLAQKRFRERKKEKMSNLHKELEAVTKKVQQLEAENRHLRLKTHVLTDVLKCLEEHLNFVQQINKCANSRRETRQVDQTSSSKELAALVEECQQMKPEDFCNYWRKYVETASDYVLQMDLKPSSPAISQIQLQNIDIRRRLKVLAVLNPGVIDKVFAECSGASIQQMLGLGPEHDPDIADEMHWAAVIRSLNLSEEQKVSALIARELLVNSIERLVSERKTLGAVVRSIVFDEKDLTSFAKRMAAPDVGLMDKLVENLKKHNNSMWLFAIFLAEHIFNDVQYAKVWVHSYPHLPMPLCMMNVLAAEKC